MRMFAVILATLAFAASAATAAESWEQISSNVGGFTVSMPGKPTLRSQPIGPHGETITMYVLEHGAFGYSVAFTDLPAGGLGPRSPEQVLDGVRANSVQGLHGKLREETPLSFQGHPGRDVIIDDPDGSVTRARYLLANERLYQVVAVVPRGQEGGAEVLQFLGSFQFTAK